jgi:hypothetical protein
MSWRKGVERLLVCVSERRECTEEPVLTALLPTLYIRERFVTARWLVKQRIRERSISAKLGNTTAFWEYAVAEQPNRTFCKAVEDELDGHRWP